MTKDIVSMSNELSGTKIAFVVANEGIEQIELTAPWEKVKEAGGTPVLIATEPGSAQAYHHLDKGESFPVDVTTHDAQARDYAGVVLPGGVMNPDQLRLDKDAQRFLQEFAASGKPIAAICHGPWTLVDAGLVEGRNLTSWPSLQSDLENAGGRWENTEVVVDRDEKSVLITSRNPDDLPAFCTTIVHEFSTSR